MSDLLDYAKDVVSRAKAKGVVTVPREFAMHFESVTKYYGCTLAEVDEMKALARKDMENAQVCFKSIYECIKA